jgi:hypothetical protein
MQDERRRQSQLFRERTRVGETPTGDQDHAHSAIEDIAEEELKALGDYVTGTNDEDGLAQALRRFVLGEAPS